MCVVCVLSIALAYLLKVVRMKMEYVSPRPKIAVIAMRGPRISRAVMIGGDVSLAVVPVLQTKDRMPTMKNNMDLGWGIKVNK